MIEIDIKLGWYEENSILVIRIAMTIELAIHEQIAELPKTESTQLNLPSITEVTI